VRGKDPGRRACVPEDPHDAPTVPRSSPRALPRPESRFRSILRVYTTVRRAWAPASFEQLTIGNALTRRLRHLRSASQNNA
jgi:hypothetical protein